MSTSSAPGPDSASTTAPSPLPAMASAESGGRPLYLRYGIALLTTAAAIGVTLAASEYFARTIFLLVFCAVGISAWYGGLGPGLVATFLGMLAIQYYFVPPAGSMKAFESSDLVSVGLFVLVASTLSALSESLREARARAENREREAVTLAQQLQEQAVELEQQIEETQMLNEELEEQNDTAHRLTSELEDANRRLAARSREQLAEAQRVARLGSWEWRIGESRVDWSDEMYRVYGLAPGSEPITYERYVSLIHPEDRQLAEETVRQAIESGAPFTMEHRIIRPDGGVRLISGRGKVVTDDAGDPVLMVGTGQDITEQREHEIAARRALSDEAARQESERARQHLESILASIGDGFITFDTGLRFTYLNPEARRLLRLAGQDPDTVIGRHLSELFPAEGMAPLLRAVERVGANGKPVRYEALLAPLGRWVEVRVHAMRDGIALYIHDVHEEKVASERTAALQRLTEALSAALTPREVSEIVLRQGMAALGATAGGVVLLTPDAGEMELVSVVGFDDRAVRPFTRFSVELPYPANDVVRRRRTVCIESVDEWRARYPVLAPTIEAGGYHAYCGAPLEIEERVLGAINYNFPERRPFSEDDEGFLRALAGQAAQALERSRLFEAERLARAQAEAANTAKMQFLTMMSHELRTPLNAIAGYSELLTLGVHGPITEQQREDLHRIQRSQKHLLGLINDILNFAKVESGHVHFDLADVPVNPALKAVEQLVSPQLRTKGLEYRFEPAPEELLVHADREKMQQVVLNLLSNAMKFTPAGGRIRLDAQGHDGVVAIRVHDTGIGIPPDKLEMIFDPFVQVSGSYTRTFEGTGLGLAISRDLARAMGGDLVAESTVGEGSTFTFSLPRREERGAGSGKRGRRR